MKTSQDPEADSNGAPGAPTPATVARRWVVRVTGALLAGLMVLIVGALAVGWATGWRTHDMTTPSMGSAAPVGTTIVSRPANASDLRVGQVIVFHPPGQGAITLAHRVVSITSTSQGIAIRTKGDINPAPDNWVIHQGDLIGTVVAKIPDLGFLIEALPVLLAGTFIVLLLTSGLARRPRRAWRIGAYPVLVGLVCYHFRPLDRVVLLDQQIGHSRGIATLVAAGVLPLRVTAIGGTHTDISPGQVGVIHLAHVPLDGAFRISSTLHLTGWWWLSLIAWFAPLLIAIIATRADLVTPVPEND